MKKIFSAILATVMLVSCMGVSALADGNFTMLEDDFETGTLNTSVWGSTTSTVVQKDGDGENYSLKTVGNFSRSLNNSLGNLIVGFDILIDKLTVSADYSTLQLTGNNGLTKPDYKRFEGKHLIGYDKDEEELGVLFDAANVSGYPASLIAGAKINDGWNNVIVKFNRSANTLKLYVNGELITDSNGKSDFTVCFAGGGSTDYEYEFGNVPIKTAVFRGLSSTYGGTNAGIYYDNIYFREEAIAGADGEYCLLTASTPSIEKMVPMTQKTFTFTYNHEIKADSLKYVKVNGTAVKSAVANENTITVTLPDNYKLEENTSYTIEYIDGMDINGSSIPNVTFRTKTIYNKYSIDFEDDENYDTNWYARYVTAAENLNANTTMGIINEPGNESNTVFQYKQCGSNSIQLNGGSCINRSIKPNADFGVSAEKMILSFRLNVKSVTLASGKDGFRTLTLFDSYVNAEGNSATSEFSLALKFKATDDPDVYDILFREYKNGSHNDKYPISTGKTITLGEWTKFDLEFDFAKDEYTAYVNDEYVGKGKTEVTMVEGASMFKCVSGIRFNSQDATDCEFYLDDFSIAQKFFGDTDYDMGFFNADGEEIDTVDTTKTIYKVTAVDRGYTRENIKLILVATDAAENRISDVRLIDFATIEKNAKDEIEIEEEFTGDLAGKKIKAFYWNDFGSLTPVSAELRLSAAEVLPASAN